MHYTASGIITSTGGRPVHRLREDSINQLDAQNFVLQLVLFHASTSFEHHLLIIREDSLNLYTGWPPIRVTIPEAV